MSRHQLFQKAIRHSIFFLYYGKSMLREAGCEAYHPIYTAYLAGESFGIRSRDS